MPPLPLKFTDDAANTIDSLERRSRFIQDESLPKLLACKGPLVEQQNLSEELREDLGVFSRQIESLSLMIDDQSGERARKELKGVVQKFTDELHELRAQTRTAILTSKKAVEARQRSNRDELFGNYSSQNGTSQSEKITEDAIMKANADVTEALRRTITTMQAELEKSVLSNQLLDSSTAALRATSNQHDTLTSAIETSKHLVTALEKADWLDRLLIISAFVFFLLVVLFILKQRFVDRGIRIMFWWTRFIPDFSGDAELLMQEEGKVTVTEVLSSATSTLAAAATTATAVTASSVAGVVSSIVGSSVSLQDSVLASPTSVIADPVETPSPSATEDMAVLSSIVPSSSLVILPSSPRTRPTEHVEL
ncbi:hypothetical protein MD484_g5609, partial [Candolleomyces efflorescens]